jgi:hypothetical protein
MHGRPRREARSGPKKKPRDSRQTIAHICEGEYDELNRSARCEMTASVATGSRKIGNMSANSCPYIGVRYSTQEYRSRITHWDRMILIHLYLRENEIDVSHIELDTMDLGKASRQADSWIKEYWF